MTSISAEKALAACLWLVAIWFALAAAGLLSSDALSDTQALPKYVPPLLLHLLYGVGLFATTLLLGQGASRVLARPALTETDRAMMVIPIGTAILTLFGVGAALSATLHVLAVGLGLALVVTASRGGMKALPIPNAAFMLIAACALGGHLGLAWRPATLDYAGTLDVGDMTIYAHQYFSMQQGAFPFVDLALEGEANTSYFNTVPTFIALFIDPLPAFDIYLYHSASLTTFYVLTLAWLLVHLFRFRDDSGYLTSSSQTALIALLVILAARYPAWLVESPPAVFLMPVALAVGYFVIRSRGNALLLVFAAAFSVAGSAATKVASIIALGAFSGLEYLRGVWTQPSKAHVTFLLFGILTVGAYAAYMLTTFEFMLSRDVGANQNMGEHLANAFAFKPGTLAASLENVGLLFIVSAAFAAREWPLGLAAALAASSHFLFPTTFVPAPAALVFLTIAVLICTRELPRASHMCLWAAALLMLPDLYYTEIGGPGMFAAWSLTLAGVVVAARAHVNPPRLAAAAAVIVSLACVSFGGLRLAKPIVTEISPELHELWLKTGELTEPDSLIFTDQTGFKATRDAGWNDYATIAKRQFFISSWQGGVFRFDESNRRARLEFNTQVLNGVLNPDEVPIKGCFNKVYAAIRNERHPPQGFKPIYQNERYALYEIAASSTGIGEGCA